MLVFGWFAGRAKAVAGVLGESVAVALRIAAVRAASKILNASSFVLPLLSFEAFLDVLRLDVRGAASVDVVDEELGCKTNELVGK